MNQEESYIEYVIKRIKTDKAMRAKLRRADNPNTNYQSWEYFVTFGVDIEKSYELARYSVVSAAIAKADPDINGNVGIGAAIALCYEKVENGEPADQAVAKLRRLLACNNTKEACEVLRSLLSFINSKNIKLDYISLLKDLKTFGEKIKTKWAKDFYMKNKEVPDDSINAETVCQ